MENNLRGTSENEIRVQQLVRNWAQAVRDRNLEAILAYHADDIVMYDVPNPFQSIGIDAYRKTWETFFTYTKAGVFDFKDLRIVADEHAAFCFATMKCADKSNSPDYVDLAFRLTVGLKKIDDDWIIIHEHHSIPSP